MLYSIFGKFIFKKPPFLVVEAGGLGFKIFVSSKTFHRLPKIGSKIKLFCYPHLRQDGLELYGFLSEKELEIFELLNSIPSVGPKIALKILSAGRIDGLLAAIDKNRIDILTKISGVGKKTAHRIILELRDKIKNQVDENIIDLMDIDADIEKTLKNLGYKQSEIKDALKDIPSKISKIDERLRMALKNLS